MGALIFVLELIGTAAFAVSGAVLGVKKGMDIFGVFILGLTTAVGGGVLRDLFAGETPYIFVKHVYASASLLGAVVYLLCLRLELGTAWASIAGMAATLLLRALSAHFRWNLPHAQGVKAPGGERPGD